MSTGLQDIAQKVATVKIMRDRVAKGGSGKQSYSQTLKRVKKSDPEEVKRKAFFDASIPKQDKEETDKDTPTTNILPSLVATGFGGAGLIWNALNGLNNDGAMNPVEYGSTMGLNFFGLPGVAGSQLGNQQANAYGVPGVVQPGNVFPSIDWDKITKYALIGGVGLLAVLLLTRK
jgi:hypothetical protein